MKRAISYDYDNIYDTNSRILFAMKYPFIKQLYSLFVCFAVLQGFAIAANNDYVVFRSEGQATQRLEGEIVNITGQDGMTFRPNDGQERKIPLVQIVDFGIVKEIAQVNAEQAMLDGDFHGAIDYYIAARQAEYAKQTKRNWVMRQQTSVLVQAYAALGETERACREFYALAESDPETVYIVCIPLPWHVELSQAAMYQRLGEMWLDRPEYPAAQLLSAGLSLTTTNREKAVAALQNMTKSQNASIAALATAQLWRVRLAEATLAEAESWEQQLETMPEALRSGQHYLLGEVFARHGRYDDALAHWLYVPINSSIMRPLAIRSLDRAIEMLDRQGRKAEAETLRLERR